MWEAVIIIPPTLEGILAEKMKTNLSQLKMNAIQFFKSAQRGKAIEGARKANLDPELMQRVETGDQYYAATCQKSGLGGGNSGHPDDDDDEQGQETLTLGEQ